MIRNLLLVVGAVGIVLLLIELGLRLSGVAYPVFMQPDERLGWSFVPGAHGFSAHEGFVHVAINRAGFRDVERRIEKEPGIYRVAVLGDSFVDATNVAEEAGFVRQIERALGAECGGRRFEVLNFGVSGYGAGQEFLLLRERVRAYKPDLVVLAFYNGNDVADTTNAVSKGWQDNKPLFTERDGKLVAEPFPTEDWHAWANWLRPIVAFVDHVRVAGVAKQVISGKPLWGKTRDATPDDQAAALAQNMLPKPQHPEMFCPPKNAVWERSWSLVEALIETMHKTVEENGARFLLVGVPEPVQAYPTEAGRAEIARRSSLCSLSYPEESLGAFATHSGIDYLPLAPALQEETDRTHVFFYGVTTALGRGHWNERGNRRGGELTAARICANVR